MRPSSVVHLPCRRRRPGSSPWPCGPPHHTCSTHGRLLPRRCCSRLHSRGSVEPLHRSLHPLRHHLAFAAATLQNPRSRLPLPCSPFPLPLAWGNLDSASSGSSRRPAQRLQVPLQPPQATLRRACRRPPPFSLPVTALLPLYARLPTCRHTRLPPHCRYRRRAEMQICCNSRRPRKLVNLVRGPLELNESLKQDRGS